MTPERHEGQGGPESPLGREAVRVAFVGGPWDGRLHIWARPGPGPIVWPIIDVTGAIAGLEAGAWDGLPPPWADQLPGVYERDPNDVHIYRWKPKDMR
jgi:hypothetical protein